MLAFLAFITLQQALTNAMTGRQGAAAVVDLKTNRVVAVHRPKTAAGLLARPGSTMKPFALAVLIESGKLLPNETFVCRRKLQIAGRNLNCSHPAIVQPMTIESALAYSCNVFVAHAAERFEDGEF